MFAGVFSLLSKHDRLTKPAVNNALHDASRVIRHDLRRFPQLRLRGSFSFDNWDGKSMEVHSLIRLH